MQKTKVLPIPLWSYIKGYGFINKGEVILVNPSKITVPVFQPDTGFLKDFLVFHAN